MRIPLLPSLLLDETFGSWFRRSAEAFRTDPNTFARAILAEEGLTLPRRFDLDTAPPAGLIDGLAKRSAIRSSELERLLIRPGGSTLPIQHRDAYCFECMAEDRRHGIIYVRRTWHDAWTLLCERHGCALGRFEDLEYRAAVEPTNQKPFGASPEPYRRNPSVVPIKLPTIAGDDGSHAVHWIPLLNPMLRQTFGRDLLVYVGSASADLLYYEITDSARLWNAVWHDAERAPIRVPNIEHPLGSIETRIKAAYIATYLWNHLRQKTSTELHWFNDLFDREYRRSEGLFLGLRSRWPREERTQLGQPFI